MRTTPRSQAGISVDFGGLLDLLAGSPAVGWIEVIAENVAGHAAFARALTLARADFGLSLHSVGLSLGSADGPNGEVLAHLRSLNDELMPDMVSDHCAWCCSEDHFLNALLPLPFTQEALGVVCRNVDLVQEALGRTILVENVSAYLRFRDDEMSEGCFLASVARRTGCGLLLDVNNLYVNSLNHGADPDEVMSEVAGHVGAFHLGGHARLDLEDGVVLFDEHGGPIAPEVWELYRGALSRWGARPSFVEWDVGSPSLACVLKEALRAQAIIDDVAAGGGGT